MGIFSQMQIDLVKLRSKKMMIATPMYGGQGHGLYFDSMLKLKSLVRELNLPDFIFYSQFSESLIPRARNYCAADFLDTKATHLLFIDADIHFNPQDVIALLHLSEQDGPYDVLCGPYAKKHVAWEKIREAVNKGVADKDPTVLEKLVGDCVFNPIKGGEFKVSELMEVAESGTGFMLIKRHVLERIAEQRPDLRYKPDHVRSSFDGSKEITCFFDAGIDPDSRRYLSEDYSFCKIVRQLGMKIWIAPWMKTIHIGQMYYHADITAQSALNLTPTVDAEKIGKKHLASKVKK